MDENGNPIEIEYPEGYAPPQIEAVADEDDIATTAEATQEAPETQVEEVADEVAESDEVSEE